MKTLHLFMPSRYKRRSRRSHSTIQTVLLSITVVIATVLLLWLCLECSDIWDEVAIHEYPDQLTHWLAALIERREIVFPFLFFVALLISEAIQVAFFRRKRQALLVILSVFCASVSVFLMFAMGVWLLFTIPAVLDHTVPLSTVMFDYPTIALMIGFIVSIVLSVLFFSLIE